MAILISAGSGAVFFVWARDNDREIAVKHLFYIGVREATIFLWAMFVFCCGLVLIEAARLIRSFSAPREIVTDAAGVTLPVGRFRGSVTIPFSTIVNLNLESVHGQALLIIEHEGGRHSVARSMMPNTAAFDALAAAIAVGHAGW